MPPIRSVIALCSASFCLTLSACSTPMVFSATPGNTPDGTAKLYATYALATSYVRVKITGSSSSPKADRPGTNSTQPTQQRNRDTEAADADKKTRNPPAADEDQKAQGGQPDVCDKIRASYDELRKAHLNYVYDIRKIDRELRPLLTGDKLTPPQVENAKSKLRPLPERQEQDDLRLKDAQTPLADYRENCLQSLGVELSHVRAPDPSHTMNLWVASDNFSSDQLTIALNDKGFVGSINATARDATADTASGAVKSLASFGIKLPGLPEGAGFEGTSESPVAKKVKLFIETPNKATLRTALDALRTVRPLDPMLPLPTDQLIKLSDILEQQLPIGGTDQPSNYELPYGLVLRADCGTQDEGKHVSSSLTVEEGLVVSAPMPCTVDLVATSDDGESSYVLTQLAFMGSDSSQYRVLPVERTRLIEQKTGYTFSDGQVTGITYDRPSPGAAAVLVPFTVVGAVIGEATGGVVGKKPSDSSGGRK